MFDLWFIGAAIVLVVGGIFLAGWREIPLNHDYILTRLGEYTETIGHAGWNWFFLPPVFSNFVLVRKQKVNQEIPPQEVQTPDLVSSSVTASLSWIPDTSDHDAVRSFIESKGEDGVAAILEDMAEERLREWAFSPNEGPQTWQELESAREEASAALLESIVGMEPISSQFPEPALLKYFASPRKNPTPSEAQVVGEHWEILEAWLASLSPEDAEAFRASVLERQKDVNDVRRGAGAHKIPQLGIILVRLSVGEILAEKTVRDAAEKRAKEVVERDAEIVELEHVRNRIDVFTRDGKYTQDEAIQLIQSERGKITKEVHETRLSVAPETRDLIKAVGGEVIAALTKKGTP